MRPRFRDAEPMAPGFVGHPWGPRRYVTQSVAVEMMTRYTDAHINTDEVLVCAVKDDAGDEVMGWVSRSVERDGDDVPTSCVVHFAYVVKAARREGLGKRLLRHVHAEAAASGIEAVPGNMNAAGIALWESAKTR